LLIFKRNRTKTYAVLEFDKLLELLSDWRLSVYWKSIKSIKIRS
jgi:hypothetical protein